MNSVWKTGRTSLGIGWTVLVIGAWLVVSPFALNFTHDPAGLFNNIAAGLVLILLTLGSTRNGLLRALIALVGAWLYISAFILPVSQKAYLWNNLILAFLTIISIVASETPYPQNYRPPVK